MTITQRGYFMDKIKAFFENKIVKIVEGVVIALASIGLILGGISVDSIAKIPVLGLGIITAIEALISLIQGFITKSTK